ncbi:Uncharacterised protein [Mycoplasmopsis californica]|uniref:Lipoprotein n=1 Tax=Mycoplasmopsis equigenitalium TaxID=114883 RepID=A0ABY5J0L1_9BACT|nr:hypothetical protein [Mycoplasmopsis equigenitalium]UUD36794.1 hypothetical protein NPA09_02755 [Mycoplasmopsis equigenitalium]VEU69908.1 Uncharacterised protein [Mycoplasmopsis californica]
MTKKHLVFTSIFGAVISLPMVAISCTKPAEEPTPTPTPTPKPNQPEKQTSNEFQTTLNDLGKSISTEELFRKLNNMKGENKTAQDFINYLNQFTTVAVVFDDQHLFEFVSFTANGKNSVTFTWKVTDKAANKSETKEVVISGFAPYIEQGAHGANWSDLSSNVVIGDLIFTHYVTTEGEKLTAPEFDDIAKEANKKMFGNQKMQLDFLKKYFQIEGDIVESNKYEYFFNIGDSHSHGTGNYHFYVTAFNKATGKIIEGADLKGHPGFSIVGWNKINKTHETEFAKQVKYEGAKVLAQVVLDELKKLTNFEEQFAALSKYVATNFEEYKKIADKQFEYQFDLTNSSAPNENTLELKIQFKKKGAASFGADDVKDIVISRFNTIITLGNYEVTIKSPYKLGSRDFASLKDKFNIAKALHVNVDDLVGTVKKFVFEPVKKQTKNVAGKDVEDKEAELKDFDAKFNILFPDDGYNGNTHEEIDGSLYDITDAKDSYPADVYHHALWIRDNLPAIIATRFQLGDFELEKYNKYLEGANKFVFDALNFLEKAKFYKIKQSIDERIAFYNKHQIAHTHLDHLLAKITDAVESNKIDIISELVTRIEQELNTFYQGDELQLSFQGLIFYAEQLGFNFEQINATDNFTYEINYSEIKSSSKSINIPITLTDKTTSKTQKITLTLS